MPQPAQLPPWPPARVGWYATALLLLAYTFSFVDRQVLNLLVEPIRQDLGISDTRISFLQGFAFTLPYILMSIPIGRMVDIFNRVGVLVGGILVWSATTFSCGLATSYAQLLLARMGVGIGEAAVTPASWSLLADYFPEERRSLPVSIYLMGPYLGGGLALMLGAEVINWTRSVDALSVPLIGAVSAWQFTFMAVALPGIAIIALLFTLKEPPRRELMAGIQPARPGWRDIFAFLTQHGRAYFALIFGVPFLVVILYGLQAWVPTILMRVYGWDVVDAGRYYGPIALVAGSAGVLCAPLLARWFRARGHQDYPFIIGIGASLLIIASLACLPWQASATGALVCVTVASFSVTLPLPLMTLAIQAATPNTMRGVVAGMYVVSTNVIGGILGPTLVGASTDYVFGDPQDVAKSLALAGIVVAPVAMLILQSGRNPYKVLVAGLTPQAPVSPSDHRA